MDYVHSRPPGRHGSFTAAAKELNVTRVEVENFTRRKVTRRDFPDHLPRRRIVHPAPTSCPCCGGSPLITAEQRAELEGLQARFPPNAPFAKPEMLTAERP
jgi:hypothetical protein